MLVDTIIQYLNAALSDLPIGFTDTFEYTKTGKNWTHPLILGHLVKAAWEVEYVSQVGIDVRLNDTKGTKFQPDLVGLNKKLKPIFAIDYESPNSSDGRIPTKDIGAYTAWREATGDSFPYVVVTTLPNKKAPRWKLRYVSKKGYNQSVKDHESEVRNNPMRFWMSYYRHCLKDKDLS